MGTLNQLLSKLPLLLCLVSLNVTAFAAVVPSGDGITVTSLEDSDTDVLQIRPPNAAGISVNHFSSFSVDNHRLNIVNLPVATAMGEPAQNAAETIVIIADTINLNNQVQLLGPASDILFLSTKSTGRITCYHCQIDNALKVGFATASPNSSIGVNSTQLGKFAANTHANMTIEQLRAPGVIAVDIISHNLALNGLIETHERTFKEADGSYRADPSGNLTVGTGSVNLFIGATTVDYDSNTIDAVRSTTAKHTLNGAINSSAVKISAAGSLDLRTLINTSTNLLSSTSYQNAAFIPEVGITVQTFAGGDLTVNKSLRTSNTISLNATGNLQIPSLLTHIEADDVELIAGGIATNLAAVNAERIHIAGNSVNNEGKLTAKVDVNIWAQKEIANQYGGLIKANLVRLHSVDQAVRNGSRTPYISRNTETNYLFDLDNYIEGLDSTQLGTFYSLDQPVNTTDSSLIMAEDNSAHIIADRIEVQGMAFENINPYYERADTQGNIVLDRKYINQVSVSAEKYLGIYAVNYIVNSSAIIATNQPQSTFEVSTAMLTNERYRSTSLLDQQAYYYSRREIKVNVDAAYSYEGVQVENNSEYGTNTLAYAPPGILFASGDFNLMSSQGFLNNTAYIEILSNAKINTPIINSIGLENQKISEYKLTGSGRCNYNHQETSTISGILGCRYYEESIEKTTRTYTVENPQELDTLFFIHGDLQANASLGWFKNHSPLDKYIAQAIENVTPQEDVYDENSGLVIPNISPVNVSQDQIDAAKETGRIEVGSKSFSLIDEIKKIYNSMVDSVTNFFNELDWWN